MNWNINWTLRFLDEALEDFEALDGSQKERVRKAIKRTQTNPLPRSKGGYGIELGHKGSANLTGFMEIKLRGDGLRAIYKLIHTDKEMLVIIIGMRKDEEVYDDADERIKRYGL